MASPSGGYLPKFPFRVYDSTQQYKTLAIDRATTAQDIINMAGKATERWLAKGSSGNFSLFLVRESATGQVTDKRALRPDEKPGELISGFRGDGKLKFYFLASELTGSNDGRSATDAWSQARPTSSENSMFGLAGPAGANPQFMPASPRTVASPPVPVPSAGNPAGFDPRRPTLVGNRRERGETAVRRIDGDSATIVAQLQQGVGNRLTVQVQQNEIAELREMLAAMKAQEERRVKEEREREDREKNARDETPRRGARATIYETPGSGKAGKTMDEFDVNEHANIHFKHLVFGKTIGEGQYGVVSKGSFFGTPVAIKQLLDVEGESYEQTLKYIKREILALVELRHPNLVQFLGYSIHNDRIYLVTEFIEGGDLHLLLKTKSIDLPWSLRISMALDITRACAYMHAVDWTHRDLKSENLLVDRNGRVKLCDLGLARKLKNQEANYFTRPQAMTVCGTNEWMSPEVILGLPYTKATDVFSFGVILGEIITRREPDERDPEVGYQVDWTTFTKHVPLDAPPRLLSLMRRCCSPEHAKRPEFGSILFELSSAADELGAPAAS